MALEVAQLPLTAYEVEDDIVEGHHLREFDASRQLLVEESTYLSEVGIVVA